jgi:hypothetical protein
VKKRRELLQRKFLAAYARAGTIKGAACAARIKRGCHYNWLEKDPSYPERFEAAHEQVMDDWEAEAARRATKGVRRVVFYKGEPIIDPATGHPYTEHRYSDILLIFLLKGGRPDKYRERREVKTEGLVKHEHYGELRIQPEVSADDLTQALAILRDCGLQARSALDVSFTALPNESKSDGSGNGK